ncbi:MFS transporter [Nocardioides sp. LHG3406-4]|uniref:MFS transporter n=1 Tax=Nocardioides sp. LHG3406-4 TaxID=2804575 RepID=UPI003CF8DBF9
MTTSTQVAGPARAALPTSWSGVFAIALGAFALVVAEFVPVGALPQIAEDLDISQGTAGLFVTATALVGMIAAPSAAILARDLDRRLVLISLTVLLLASSVLSALADSFVLLLVARLVLGAGVGGFWAISISAAARLVPPDRVHTASSMVFGGIAIGSVVSVPASTLIASHASWHVAFAAAAVLAVLTLVAQALMVPRIVAHEAVGLRHFLDVFGSRRITLLLAGAVLIVSGHFAAYTFIVPYLRQTTHLGSSTVSGLLLMYGTLTVVGNFVGGAAAGRRLLTTVATTGIGYTVSLVLVSALGSSEVVIVGLVGWALAWGAAPVGIQLWLHREAEGRFSGEAVQALYTCLFQLSIALGSLLGSITVNVSSERFGMWLGAVLVAAATVAVLFLVRVVRSGGRRASLRPADGLG